MEERPKLNIKLDTYDRIIEAIGLIGLLILIILPIYYYSELPEIIPRHFDLNGKPDGYSNKKILWTLPIIGVLMFGGLYYLSKKPHLHNYSTKITKNNAENLYKISSKMIRTLNSIIAYIFTYITYSTIQISLGKTNGLGKFFTPIFFILMFGTLLYFYLSSKNIMKQ